MSQTTIRGLEMPASGQALARVLHQRNLVRFHEPGNSVPVSFHLRTPENPEAGGLTDDMVEVIAKEMLRIARRDQLEFQHIAGVPDNGDPLAAALHKLIIARAQDAALIKLNRASTTHGTKITCTPLPPHVRALHTILPVHDIVLERDVWLKSLAILKQNEKRVTDLCAVIDCQLGGSDYLQSLGYAIRSIFTLRQLLMFYHADKMISEGTFRNVLAFLDQRG